MERSMDTEFFLELINVSPSYIKFICFYAINFNFRSFLDVIALEI